MNYSQVKKLDQDTAKKLEEGSGPVDECLCSLLSPPDDSKSLRGSIKRALASIGGRKVTPGASRYKGGFATIATGGPNTVQIPLTFEKGGAGIFTTKEQIKRTTSCGKCGCDKEKFFMKHSYANIRITSPDVSTICPCPSDCMPGKEKLNNNISVTIEHVTLAYNNVKDYDTNVDEIEERANDEKIEPVMDKPSAKELVEHVWKEWTNIEDEWYEDVQEEGAEDMKTLDIKLEQNDVATSEHSVSFCRIEEHEKTVCEKLYPE